MSDDFEDAAGGGGDSMDFFDDDEAGYDQSTVNKKRRRSLYDDEDEDDEEDDEEDEEEDEDDDVGDKKRKRKRRKRRTGVSAFIDAEAEVDDDDDEDEDEEVGIENDFVVPEHYEGMEAEGSTHRGLHRRHEELNDEEMRRIADRYKQRGQSAAAMYKGDMDSIPQRLLMPSVEDANLWQVRVKPGREKDLVFGLMRKSMKLEFSAQPLQILSAFQHDSLPGMIYIEARGQQAVLTALQGFVGVFLSRGITLVPIDEMASLLQIRKKEVTLNRGDWVRIKRGRYVGDLAQVIDLSENGEDVGLRFVPRIELNPRDDQLDGKKKGSRTATTRPPQRLFNYEEVIKVYGRKAVTRRPGASSLFVFQGETYVNGFCEKDFRISAITTDNVAPTLEEVERFSARKEFGLEAESGKVDLSVIADAARKAAIVVLQPGDHVEVYEGEQTGVTGVVESVMGDIVTLRAEGVDIDGQKIEVPARSVRKRFKPGDHVKVMTGKNVDESGLVVSVADNVVTFISDMSMQEVSVFAKDLREAAEVGASTNIVGNYELHDLVQLDPMTVGVIFKTERDSFRVLDHHGQVRTVQPHQISMRQNKFTTIATDSEGYELSVGDNLKEVDGEGRKGRLLHVYQSYFAFLHNREIAENGGVFVARARSLAPLAPRGTSKTNGMDLTKMNPAVAGGAAPGTGSFDRGHRDPFRGVPVTIVQGGYKGYIGTIKETNGVHARVELSTNNKTITIERSKLRRREANGALVALEAPRRGGFGGTRGANVMGPAMGPPRTPNPYGPAGGKTPGWGPGGDTPGWGAGGATPAWGNGGRTPGWGAGGKTPNAFGSSATPAWQANSRTPNPYGAGGAGGRTPNPYAAAGGGRTPNPYAGGAGGRTPQVPRESSGWGEDDSSSGWGAADKESRPSGNGWGDSNASTSAGGWGDGWDAPARPVDAPTPTAYSAPTPFTAPTPAAPTPAAPTPSASGPDEPYSTGAGRQAYTGAPTPYGSAPTPFAASAATPFSAPTPGGALGGGHEPAMPRARGFALDSRWLLDPVVSDPQRGRGLVVRFSGLDRRSDGWKAKADELEGKQGVVISVFNPGEGYASTATVLLADGDGSEETAPVELLVPVHPTRQKQQAIPLNGPHKGEVVQIEMIDDPIVFYTPLDVVSFKELKIDQLCLWEPTS